MQLRKPLMQRQRHCYNRSQTSRRSMPSISKDKSQSKKMTKTLRKICLLTLSILTCLVGSTPNNLSPTRAKSVKKIKTTREVLGVIAGKNRVTSTTSLQQVSTLLKKKRKTSLTSNALTARKKFINPTSILRT